MNKLEYDSLHKFFVSIGLTCIVLPFGIIAYLFKKDVQLISANDYKNLSNYSTEALSFQYRFLKIVNNKAFIVCFFIIMAAILLLGIYLIFKGLSGWKKVQKDYDRIVEMERIEHEFNIEHLDETEVAEKAEREIKELSENTDNIVLQTATSSVSRYMKLETAYFNKYLTVPFKRRHIIERNVRADNYEYDAIAVSRYGNNDFLYEIKCNTTPLPINVLKMIVFRFFEHGEKYGKDRNRNINYCLVFISNTQTLEHTKNQMEKVLKEYNNNSNFNKLEIQYINEQELLD